MPQYQGVWTLEAQAQALTNQQWVTDPNFKNTTLLLQADGTGSGSQNQTFLDGSTNNFFITRNGNTTQGSFSPFSQAPGYWSNYFGTSTSDTTTFASNAAFAIGTGNFSVEFFVNFSTWSGTNQRFFEQGVSGTDGILIERQSGTDALRVTINTTSIIAYSWVPQLGRWYHIAATRSGSTVTLYIDGTSVATGTSSASIAQNPVNVGGITWATGFVTQGYLSNVRYSNVARTITVPTSPYVSDANTLILTAQSNRFVDNSSNAFAVTIGGTPSVQAFGPFAPALQWTPDVVGGSGYYDGSGDYLNAGTNTAFNIFNQTNATVEFWIYLNAAYSSDIDPICYYQGSNDFWMVQLAGGQAGKSIRFYTILGGSAVTLDVVQSSTTFQPFQWNHCAFVKSGSNWYTFINGAQVATAATAPTRSYTTGTLNIGCRTSGVNLLNGYLGGLRITNTVVYSGSTYTVPSVPLTAISGTQILLNNTNAGIYDGKMGNVLETVGNVQVSTSPVKYGSGSMYFNGSTGYLYAVSNPGLNLGSGPYTIELWYWPNEVANDVSLISKYSSAEWLLQYLPSAGPAFRFAVNTNQVSDFATTLTTGSWYHIAITRDSIGSLRCFKNGVQVGSTIASGSGAAQNVTPTTNYFNLGCRGNGTQIVNGYMDDVRITIGVARYIANFTPPQQALPRQ
jgi:hypothetical protein